MKLLEDIILKDVIEIRTSPEKIYNFFLNLNEENYRKWVPEDHVTLRWIKGSPSEKGSIVYGEEYFHGKLHKVKFRIKNLIPNKKIEFSPSFWLLRIYFPKNTFTIEQKGDTCIFTATIHLRIGKVAKFFAKNHIKGGLESVRLHMKKEGEDLKKILEDKNL